MSQAETNGSGVKHPAGVYIHKESGATLEAITPIQGDAFVRLGYTLATEEDLAPAAKPLKGLSKAKLLAIAEEEGVEVDPEATNAVITEAIEENRKG